MRKIVDEKLVQSGQKGKTFEILNFSLFVFNFSYIIFFLLLLLLLFFFFFLGGLLPEAIIYSFLYTWFDVI